MSPVIVPLYMYVCMCACVYVCMCVCVYVCMRVCMYVYVHISCVLSSLQRGDIETGAGAYVRACGCACVRVRVCARTSGVQLRIEGIAGAKVKRHPCDSSRQIEETGVPLWASNDSAARSPSSFTAHTCSCVCVCTHTRVHRGVSE